MFWVLEHLLAHLENLSIFNKPTIVLCCNSKINISSRQRILESRKHGQGTNMTQRHKQFLKNYSMKQFV